MLPLQSKTTPTDRGASSLENWLISCSFLSSNNLKFSFSRPVTKRLYGSVTVTGMSTRVLSTRMLERGATIAFPVGLARGSTETLGSAEVVSAAHTKGASRSRIALAWDNFRWDGGIAASQPFFFESSKNDGGFVL